MSSYVDEQIRKMWTSTQNYQEPKNDAIQTERQKWIKAIEDIKAEIEKITPKVVHDHDEMEIYNVRKYDIDIIDKHTKELL